MMQHRRKGCLRVGREDEGVCKGRKTLRSIMNDSDKPHLKSEARPSVSFTSTLPGELVGRHCLDKTN